MTLSPLGFTREKVSKKRHGSRIAPLSKVVRHDMDTLRVINGGLYAYLSTWNYR